MELTAVGVCVCVTEEEGEQEYWNLLLLVSARLRRVGGQKCWEIVDREPLNQLE